MQCYFFDHQSMDTLSLCGLIWAQRGRGFLPTLPVILDLSLLSCI